MEVAFQDFQKKMKLSHFEGSFDDDGASQKLKATQANNFMDDCKLHDDVLASFPTPATETDTHSSNSLNSQQQQAQQPQGQHSQVIKPSAVAPAPTAPATATTDNHHSHKRGARRESVQLQELSTLTNLLGDLSNTLKEVSEKVQHHHAVTHMEENGDERDTLMKRLKDNNLREMFVGHEVVGEEVDNVVNTLTLMNALILTIPYSLMSAADHNYWDWVQQTLDECESKSFSFGEDFWIFKNSYNAVVYSTMSSLVMSLIYYLLKPRQLAKFRRWWKHARYVILMTLVGTVCSVVSLVAVSCWLFAWFIIPTNMLCEYNSQEENMVGIATILLCSITAFYLMI